MKTLRNVLMVLLLCGAAVMFMGCDQLANALTGVDVTIKNETNSKCKITYVDFYENSEVKPEDSDDYNISKITISANSSVVLNVEPNTKIEWATEKQKGKKTISLSDITITIEEENEF